MLWSVVSRFYFTARDDLFSTNQFKHTNTHTFARAYVYKQGLNT